MLALIVSKPVAALSEAVIANEGGAVVGGFVTGVGAVGTVGGATTSTGAVTTGVAGGAGGVVGGVTVGVLGAGGSTGVVVGVVGAGAGAVAGTVNTNGTSGIRPSLA